MIEVSIEDNGLTTRLTALAARAGEPGTEVMGEIGKLLTGSVRENFAQEGRPSQWVPSRSAIEEGRKTLTKSGRLANSPTVTQLSDTSVEVTTGGGLGMYPVYLSKGVGPVTVTPAMRKFFLAMFLQTGLPMWRSMLSKDMITIKPKPARRFSVIQDTDAKEILNSLRHYILNGETSIEIK